MAPPVLIIAGGAVIAVGGLVAFHQFVYEPHIAPRLEIFVENWLEQRRLRRRLLTRAVSFGGPGEAPGPPSNASHATTQVEMDTISAPLRATGIDSGLSAAALRRRSNPAGAHESPSFVLESPNVFIPFGTLTPVSTADPLPEGQALSSPRLSTPSTVPSSLMELPSPSLRGTASLTAFDTRGSSSSDHSRRSSSDSILADATHLSFTAISPVHSVTHISPRALFITLASPIEPAAVDEDPQPLSDFTPARRRDTVTYPSLGIAPQVRHPQSSTQSLMGSTIYESFAPSTRSVSPINHPLSQAVHEDTAETARATRFPSPGRLLPPGRRAPRSTASWSDVGSDGGDEPEFLVGSDVESWASVSDRAGP